MRLTSCVILAVLPFLTSGTNHPGGHQVTQAGLGDVSNLFPSLSSSSNTANKPDSSSPPPAQGSSATASSRPTTTTSSSAPSSAPPQNQNPQVQGRANAGGNDDCNMLPQSRLYLFQDNVYFLSPLDSEEKTRLNDWFTAREFCKFYCMDLVAIETPEELAFIGKLLGKVSPNQRVGVWTSGFFCPSGNCTSLPFMQTPWVYTSNGKNVPSALWSKTGEASLAQPDDFYHRVKLTQETENCMALLRNWYNDGCVAHDMLCEQMLLGVACEAKIPQSQDGQGQSGGSNMMYGGMPSGGMMYGGMPSGGMMYGGMPVTMMPTYGSSGMMSAAMPTYGQSGMMPTTMPTYGQSGMMSGGMSAMSGYGQGQGMTPTTAGGYPSSQGQSMMNPQWN